VGKVGFEPGVEEELYLWHRKCVTCWWHVWWQMSSSEDKGLLWQLFSEMAALSGHSVVDTGAQTDSTRYHAIVPLRQCLLYVAFRIILINFLFAVSMCP